MNASLYPYVCPKCKGRLQIEPHTLCCPACSHTYPLVAGHIPDFLAPQPGQPVDSLVEQMERLDYSRLRSLTRLYESPFWYQLVVAMFMGANATTLPDLVRRIQSTLDIDHGRILDAACGPATYGRRLATPSLSVYGIDLSLTMLQQGIEYAQRDGATNLSLARTRVEQLPFPDAFFDFAVCSGSLHLFPDATAALREIGRTLKPGARLVGLTFSAGPRGLVRYAWFRRRIKQRGTIHLFEPEELAGCFRQAGYDHYQPQMLGSGIFFQAQKGTSV